jgi:hypothetical protein
MVAEPEISSTSEIQDGCMFHDSQVEHPGEKKIPSVAHHLEEIRDEVEDILLLGRWVRLSSLGSDLQLIVLTLACERVALLEVET